ncbi:Hypothetical protein NTJ_02192 [Nesidiocoris tenuis]|uniref:Major facilitator superfamily associated domain-containing protein n=1 Tax=Nesidiocoris tenuis TaxID=355587 RepID=A0ABN7AEV0_9HEMI|nr:Hypothetical protein NTJ_02192 [Nesidiocoris tenuis]
MSSPKASAKENQKRRNTRSKSSDRIRSKSKPELSLPEVSPGKAMTGRTPQDLPSDQPQEVEEVEEGKLLCSDKLVIYTVWTSEVLFIVISAWTHRIMEDKSHHGERHAHVSFWYDLLLTCTICAVMFFVGLFGDYFGRWFCILISGLSIFSLSPVVGILSLHFAVLPIVLSWLQVFWYATVPCRLWLVYHQKFPLPIHDTHNLVSVNELLIEISEWLSVVFIEGSTVQFSYSIYLTAWSLTLLAALGYCIATFLIRKSVNNQPSDVDFTRDVYRTTEVIDIFDRRQSKISVVVFLLILYSGGIFTIVKEYLAVSILQLGRKVYYPSFGGIVQYRLDLIVSVVTMLIVEFQISSLKILRDEMKDLVLIAVAHAVNVVVLVLLFIVVSKIESGFLATEPLNFGTLEFYNPVHYSPFFLECDGQAIKNIKPTVSGFMLIVNGQRDVVCRGWRSDNDTLFNETVTLRENMRSVYLIKKPALVRVESFGSWKPVPVSNIVLMNAVDFCTPGNLNLSNLCSSQSVCLPLKVEMIARSAENETLLAQEVSLPRIDKTSDFIALPKSTAEIEMRYNHTVLELRESMNVTVNKFVHPDFWPLRSSFFIGPDPTIMVLFFFTFPKVACLPMVDANYLKTFKPDTEMIAPSVLMGIAWGVAAVGYTHFMWIQSPVRWRTSIIAIYSMQHFLFAWLARTCLLVNVGTATSVLVIQCVSTLVHVAFTFWFYCRLPPVQQEQLKRKGGRRF